VHHDTTYFDHGYINKNAFLALLALSMASRSQHIRNAEQSLQQYH
jgi:hypothetical protein